jgi:hypothetical protein
MLRHDRIAGGADGPCPASRVEPSGWSRTHPCARAYFPYLRNENMQRKAWIIALAAAFAALSAHAQQAGEPSPVGVVQGEVVAYQAVSDAAGTTKIYRSIRTADPADARRSVVVEQVLKQVAPGRVTFVRGEQPADAVRHRQQQCAALGAIDVTEESDVTLDERILDASLCKSTNPQQAASVRAAAPVDSGITIIVPGILARIQQPTQLPIHLWVSTARIGDVTLSVSSEPFGVGNLKFYTYGGVNNFQSVLTVRAVKLGMFPIYARACAPGIGCVDDSRGRINVVAR